MKDSDKQGTICIIIILAMLAVVFAVNTAAAMM
jgi:hypothetical protein